MGEKRFQIGVICPAGPEEYPKGMAPKDAVYEACEIVGKLLARRGVIVVTGGKSGGMEAAARGAKSEGGLTVGVISGGERFTSNSFTDVEFVSSASLAGLDEFFLVSMCDGIIAVGGGAGTLEELTIAYRNKKPIVLLRGSGGWADRLSEPYLDERRLIEAHFANTPEEAVEMLMKTLST